jgi:DNA-binding Lrp family transcriptional regulator
MVGSLFNKLKKEHPYREALHILLYDYPQGLSAQDIAEKLNISDIDCQNLLRIEEITDAINVDPYTGTLIYRSQKIISSEISLSEAIRRIYLNKVLTGVHFFIITIIAITACVYIYPQVIQYLQERSLKSRADVEIAAQNKSELLSQRDYLKMRIIKMEAVNRSITCESDWKQERTCYTEGRLLSKKVFNRELKEMRVELRKINELLTNSYKN